MVEQLEQAVAVGLVQVEARAGGYLFTGADQDALVIDALEELGAVWRDDLRGWWVQAPEGEDLRVLKRMRDHSAAVAAAVAARGIRAKRDGSAEYDKRRAAQIRALTRGIKDVYRLAIQEHQAELDALIEASKDPVLDPMEALRRANRRKELEAVLDALAGGLAKAGSSAAALTLGMLPEAQAIGRRVTAWQIDNISGVNVSRMVANQTAALSFYRDYTKPKYSEDEIAEATKLRRGYDARAWANIQSPAAAKKVLKASLARGLLTGEHPRDVAKRLEGTFNQWSGRALVIARTETCRIMSEASQEYIRATNDVGVKCRNRWDATLDGSTRESHRDVDGEVRAVGEKFSNGLKRPGDGPAGEVINCRCCLTPVVEGFEPDVRLRMDNETKELIPYVPYREWEKMKQERE